jgi:hypothetical protein
MFKYGVKCLRCNQILYDKSGFNRHHNQRHKEEGAGRFEANVPYLQVEDRIVSDFDWTLSPLSKASPLHEDAAPGLLERETKILSKGNQMYSDPQFSAVGDPGVLLRDEAVCLLDEIDELAWSASAVTRCQVGYPEFVFTI